MSNPSIAHGRQNPPADERRRYNSPLRRERAAETRARILTAGSELVHGFPSWDWRNLTFRAVAEHAGVSERTVYRHFATEQDLHRAVMHRLEEEAGVTYEGLELGDLATITSRVFAALPSFAVPPSEPEPPFPEEDLRRRQALDAAVSRAAVDWSTTQREMAAAMLDVIWAAPAYERLTTTWNLDLPNATRAVTWVIGLVQEAIENGHRPTNGHPPPKARPRPKKSAATPTAKRKKTD